MIGDTIRSKQFFWVLVICGPSASAISARNRPGAATSSPRASSLLGTSSRFLVILPVLGLVEKPRPLPGNGDGHRARQNAAH